MRGKIIKLRLMYGVTIIQETRYLPGREYKVRRVEKQGQYKISETVRVSFETSGSPQGTLRKCQLPRGGRIHKGRIPEKYRKDTERIQGGLLESQMGFRLLVLTYRKAK